MVNVASACVIATPAIGNVGFCDTDSHTLDVLHPAIQVVKTVNKPVITAGTTVVYGYSVTNPGDIALSGVKVTDNKCGPSSGLTRTGGDTDSDNLLDPGEIWTFTCSAAIGVDTDNTATAEGTAPSGPKVTDTDTITVDVVRPGLTVDKTGPPQAREGDVVIYRFAVTNTGDVALTGVSVDDTILGHIDTIPALGVGITVNLEKAYTIPPGQTADVTNAVKACVIGAPGLGSTELCSTTDSHTLDVIHPAILVDKTVDQGRGHSREAVVYSYAVTNPGDVALSGVTVTDDKCGPVTFVSGDTDGDQKFLDPGERWLYRCTTTIAVDTNNTAVATGTPPVGLPVTGTDTAFVDVVNPLLDIAKTGPAGAREGDTVTYDFAVRNIGDVPLKAISVDDDILGHIGTIPELAAGASVTLHKDYVIPAGHPADVVNLASACVTGAPGSATPPCATAPPTPSTSSTLTRRGEDRRPGRHHGRIHCHLHLRGDQHRRHAAATR